MIGEKGKDLNCLANYYYDIKKCGVGFHGDEESRRVIGIRLDASIPLHYQWFSEGKAIGSRFEVILNDGDLYIMGSKAVGYDWKNSSIITIRHAAGAAKYLQMKASINQQKIMGRFLIDPNGVPYYQAAN